MAAARHHLGLLHGRAQHFPSEAAAQAALDKAKKFMKPALYRKARTSRPADPMVPRGSPRGRPEQEQPK